MPKSASATTLTDKLRMQPYLAYRIPLPTFQQETKYRRRHMHVAV